MHIHSSSFLLVFEGIEGSGKTTQINYAKEFLEHSGYSVTCLREPGGTHFGEKLRSAILDSETKIHPLAEAHLFASARAQILFEKIIPLLEQEKNVVILDRYFYSSVAYQGFARKLGAEKIESIHKEYPLNLRAKICFYLKIDLATSHQRQAARGNEKDYFEKSNDEFYHDLISGYDYCANTFDEVKTIEASKDIQEVKNIMLQKLKEQL